MENNAGTITATDSERNPDIKPAETLQQFDIPEITVTTGDIPDEEQEPDSTIVFTTGEDDEEKYPEPVDTLYVSGGGPSGDLFKEQAREEEEDGEDSHENIVGDVTKDSDSPPAEDTSEIAEAPQESPPPVESNVEIPMIKIDEIDESGDLEGGEEVEQEDQEPKDNLYVAANAPTGELFENQDDEQENDDQDEEEESETQENDKESTGVEESKHVTDLEDGDTETVMALGTEIEPSIENVVPADQASAEKHESEAVEIKGPNEEDIPRPAVQDSEVREKPDRSSYAVAIEMDPITTKNQTESQETRKSSESGGNDAAEAGIEKPPSYEGGSVVEDSTVITVHQDDNTDAVPQRQNHEEEQSQDGSQEKHELANMSRDELEVYARKTAKKRKQWIFVALFFALATVILTCTTAVFAFNYNSLREACGDPNAWDN